MALVATRRGAKPQREDGLRVCEDCGVAKAPDEFTR